MSHLFSGRQSETTTFVSNAPIEAAFDKFQQHYPDFEKTWGLDTIRAHEYPFLDDNKLVYLDYANGSLQAARQLHKYRKRCAQEVDEVPRKPSQTLLNDVHGSILKFFNAPQSEYVVILTQSAMSAVQLVGQNYPFSDRSSLLLSADNHRAVNQLAIDAETRKAQVDLLPITTSELRLDSVTIQNKLSQRQVTALNLFAFPLMSNFSGVKHPLSLIGKAQAKGWDVFVDATNYAATEPLDIDRWRPEFALVSFHELIGYPSTVAALIAKKSALTKLKWTTEQAYPEEDGCFLDQVESENDYIAIQTGIEFVDSIGLDVISERVTTLTGWILEQLQSIRHSNGRPVVRIYGPHDLYMRGGIINLNFLDTEGNPLPEVLVKSIADQANVSLTYGVACNPGAAEIVNRLLPGTLRELDQHPEHIRNLAKMRRRPGSVRISLGTANNFADAYAFVEYARQFINQFPQ